MDLKKEKYYWKKGYKIIIGLDEAGRGPLSGPVTAAATIINSKIKNQKSKSPRTNCSAIIRGRQFKNQNFRKILKETKDSKQLSEKQREEIFKLIKKSPCIKFVHSSVGPKTIDKINIERATQKAMKNCLKKINLKPDIILIDGNRTLPENLKTCPEHIRFAQYKLHRRIPQRAIVKGDDKIFSIALASIIAKVIRDRKMKKLSLQYPKYYFHQHKGYGTKLHKKLIKKYGPCEIHRKSFKSCNMKRATYDLKINRL